MEQEEGDGGEPGLAATTKNHRPCHVVPRTGINHPSQSLLQRDRVQALSKALNIPGDVEAGGDANGCYSHMKRDDCQDTLRAEGILIKAPCAFAVEEALPLKGIEHLPRRLLRAPRSQCP
ncbi:hypothetical protein EYF80_003784 [Liparis tanakae]|uniref:Uncharacterized protein n=1 Tax=Liparis tanakae TaxID=230148 RepID=A0A4Z2J727_9TELE|nr:hypothetical protein EYF80_003784 [Liparis tanakae]